VQYFFRARETAFMTFSYPFRGALPLEYAFVRWFFVATHNVMGHVCCAAA